MGSTALVCLVQPEKTIAKYANGMLIVNVPYKEAPPRGVKVKIDQMARLDVSRRI
jgi:HSP20 family molecular chaperone IbpA